MNQCRKCNQTENLLPNKNLCKSCNNIIVKDYYHRTERYQHDIARRANDSRQRSTIMISNFKEHYGCAFCKETDPCCLEFHHLDPIEKRFHINGSSKKSVEAYKSEIIKCEIVCANCHKKIHADKIHIVEKREFDLTLLQREGK